MTTAPKRADRRMRGLLLLAAGLVCLALLFRSCWLRWRAAEERETVEAAFRTEAAQVPVEQVTVTASGHDLRLNICLSGPYETAAAFAADCRTLTDVIRQQSTRPGSVVFFYDGIGEVDAALNAGTSPAYSYTLALTGPAQLDWTAEEMCAQTEETALLDEENAAEN